MHIIFAFNLAASQLLLNGEILFLKIWTLLLGVFKKPESDLCPRTSIGTELMFALEKEPE